nr:zinc finger MYM-type protein 5-like [Parasteatoda tepidariorum]
MNRTALSGCQKRKRAAAEVEKISKLPKLTSWLISSETKSQNTSTTENYSSTFTNAQPILSEDSTEPGLAPVDEVYNEISEEKELNEKKLSVQSTDPGLWNVKDLSLVDYWIRVGPSSCQNSNREFSNSCRVYETGPNNQTVNRYLTKNVFERKLRNGECIKREWLLYSPSLGKLFCFVCRLLSHKESPFSTLGFNDWKHSHKVILDHENGKDHQACLREYFIKHKKCGSVDSMLIDQYCSEREKWQKILTRVVATIRFLASRGLSFRGDNQKLGSIGNGNFLGDSLVILIPF